MKPINPHEHVKCRRCRGEGRFWEHRPEPKDEMVLRCKLCGEDNPAPKSKLIDPYSGAPIHFGPWIHTP